ncbi:4-coumarate--CoA ligase 3 [Aphelenchoides bicaudatus]|nr:4-coumarate--CoA ligase 3 [Aphelenchoides bicaudatus]
MAVAIVRGKIDVPATEGNYADELLSQIWKHSIESPNRPAFINGEDASEQVTFGQLYLYSMSVSAFLQQRGFRKGDMAAFITHNCWEVSTIFMGVIQIGGVLTAANSDFTNELERQLRDSKCRVVFCSEDAVEKIIQASRTAKSIEVIVVIDRKPQKEYPHGIYTYTQIRQTPPVLLYPKPETNAKIDLIMLPYSSGTTVKWFLFIGPDYDPTKEKSLLFLPFYHLFGLCNSLSSLWLGYTGIILSRFNAQLFCQNIQDNKIRYLACVPPICVFLANNPLVDQYDLHSLKCLLSGAAPAGEEIAYGMTEMAMVPFMPTFDEKERQVNGYPASGIIRAHMEAKITDTKTGELLNRNQPGQLCVRGAMVMRGYFNRPEATAETIDQDGWLLTGDIAFLELIKYKGFQVPPAELEDLLMSHPRIRDAAVIGVPDQEAGELPKAFIVRADNNLSAEDVKNYVKEKTVHYKHLRGGVEFLNEIPKSAAGKILRRQLRDLEASRLKQTSKI